MNDIMNDRNGFIFPFTPKDQETLTTSEKLKYHYTSPAAFLSILQSGNIRFSDVRFMNDKAEKIYFLKVLLEFIEDNRSRYPALEETTNRLLGKNNFQDIKQLKIQEVEFNTTIGSTYEEKRIFLFCTSGHADALNMWNYYVNNGQYQGYNIGFRMEQFLNTFDTRDSRQMNSFSVYYGNILYKKTDQHEVIKTLAEELERKSINSSSDHLVPHLRQYIETKGLFFKDKVFAPEDEFRIIIAISHKHIPHSLSDAKKYFGDNNKMIYEEFCIKNGLVVPYLNVKLPQESVSRIMTPPMAEHDLAKLSIREILDIGRYKGVQIRSSGIPIRF